MARQKAPPVPLTPRPRRGVSATAGTSSGAAPSGSPTAASTAVGMGAAASSRSGGGEDAHARPVLPTRRAAAVVVESPRAKQRRTASAQAGAASLPGGHIPSPPGNRPSSMRTDTSDGSGSSGSRRSRRRRHGRQSASSSSDADSAAPPPSARLSLRRRRHRGATLELIKTVVKEVVGEVIKDAVNEMKDYVAEKAKGVEGRIPSPAAMAAAVVPDVSAAVATAVGQATPVNNVNLGMSPAETRAAVAECLVVPLMRSAHKVSLSRKIKKTHCTGGTDSITFIAPPARMKANLWAREHSDHIIYGTVNRTYKAIQALPIVPAVFESKTQFSVDSQDEVDKSMVAVTRNSLADGRAALRARFYTDIGFFKVWGSSTVRIRMLHPQEEEPLAARAAGSKYYAFETTRVVTPVGAVVPAEGGAAAAAPAALGARVITEEGCLVAVADGMLQLACRSPSSFEPIVLKALASNLRTIIVSTDPMWSTMREADITTTSNGPGRWYLLCPRLGTRARLGSGLCTMTADMMGALPPPDPEAPLSDSDSEAEGEADAGGGGEKDVQEGPNDW